MPSSLVCDHEQCDLISTKAGTWQEAKKKNHHSVEKIKPEVEVKRINALTHRTSACIFFSHLNIVLNSDDTMLEINVKPTSVT